MKNVRICKLKTVEKTLTYRKFYNLEDCRFYDQKDKPIECVILDPNGESVLKFFKDTPPLVGSIFRVMITKSKNRKLGKRIITAILEISRPIQVDIEHLI